MFYFLSSLFLYFFFLFLCLCKIFIKSKSWLNSFSFRSNHLFHQGSFFVFGSLLPQTNSELYAATIYIDLLQLSKTSNINFLKPAIDIVRSILHFALGIPCNIMSCSNISFSCFSKMVPCFSASLVTTSHSSLLLY